MVYKILNHYKIITFDKNQYNNIVSSIINSRAYVSYIDPIKDEGKSNFSFQKYLLMKTLAYYQLRPKSENSVLRTSLYESSEKISDKEISQAKEFGISDDYYYKKTIIGNQNDKSYNIVSRVLLVEDAATEMSFQFDSILENTTREYMNSNFVFKNKRRFTLIPFIAKYDNKYIEPTVIANVYSEGIIVLQFIIPFETDESNSLLESNLKRIVFPEVKFYKKLKKYKPFDFFEKESRLNINIWQISDYYKDLVDQISGVNTYSDWQFTQASWVFADFNSRTDYSHDDFIKKHKKVYISHLTNADDEVINRKFEEDTDDLLNQSIVWKTQENSFLVTPALAILSFGAQILHKTAVENLKDEEKDLKKEGIYEQELISKKKQLTLKAMFDFLPFYELSFIKKFYIKNLILNLSQGEFKRLNDYIKIKSDLDFVIIKYDEELLFNSEGSPKELYKKILKRTGTDELLLKAQNFTNNARDNVSRHRENELKKKETLVLTMTSFLTVVLSFVGIKAIVVDVLSKITFWGAFTAISDHPVRTSVLLWVFINTVMAVLLFIRYRYTKK